MLIALLGTGQVGRTLAARFAELGHTVVMGTRDPDATRLRTLDDGTSMSVWTSVRGLPLASAADAVAASEIVVNATRGTDALTMLDGVDLGDRVLLDVANPIEMVDGGVRLSVCNDDSLAERLQRAHPGARVVKALNTMNVSVMANPGGLGEETTTPLAGDDATAKGMVRALLGELGHSEILDLGGLRAARGMEMYLPLWLATMGALGTASFNYRIVR